MKSYGIAKSVLHKGLIAMVLVLCFAVMLSCVGFSFADLTNTGSVSRANTRQISNDTLLTPDSNTKVQTLAFSDAYDWTQEITQTFGENTLYNRVTAESNYAGQDSNGWHSPTENSTSDDGRLKTGSQTQTGRYTVWNMLYEFAGLEDFIEMGALEINASYKFERGASTWGVFSIIPNDSPTTYNDDLKGSGCIAYKSENGNYTYNSGWQALTKSNATLQFYLYSSTISGRGEFYDIVVKFKINWDIVANKLAGFSTSTVSTYDSQIGTPNLYGNVRDDVVFPEVPEADGDKYLHTPSTFKAWTNVGQRILFNVETAEGIKGVASGSTLYDGVLFTLGGVTKNFDDAKSAGWLSSGSSIQYVNNLLSNARCDWTFTNNGVYTVRFDSYKNRYLEWQITIGGIDKTAPSDPTLSINPNGLNDWFIGNADKNKITLGINADISNENFNATDITGRTATVRYYYAVSHSTSAFANCPNIADATSATLNSWKTGYVENIGDFELPIQSGYYKIRVVAVDYAGNLSQTSTTYEFKVDNNNPLFTPSITQNAVLYKGNWTNKTITASFLNNSNISGVTYKYRTYNDSTASVTDWVAVGAVGENILNIGGISEVINTRYQFKAVSDAGLEFTPTFSTTGFSNENGYVIKYDSIVPDKPIYSVGSSTNLNNFIKPELFADAVWYTSGWTVFTEFTVNDDFIGQGVRFAYEIKDEGIEIYSNTSQINLENNASNIGLNFNVENSRIGGVKVLKYWVIDQAGNVSEPTEIKVLIDANSYKVNASIASNSLFPTSPGRYLDLISAGYVRGDNSSTVRIMPTNGYNFYKLISNGVDIQEQLTDLVYTVDFRGDDFNSAPSDVAMEAYFRRIVTITGSTTATYNGMVQGSILQANIVDDTINFVNSIDVYYNDILGVNSVIKAEEYSVTFDAQNFNNNNDNYIIIANSYLYTIKKANLTIAVDAGQTKVYGDDDPTIIYTVSGLQGADNMSGKLGRASGENVGTYLINVGSLVVEGGRGNCYNINYTFRNFTIVKRSVTIRPNTNDLTLGEYKNAPYDFVNDAILGTNSYLIDEGSVRIIDGVPEVLDLKFSTCNSNVGVYALVPASSSNGDANIANPNYNLTFVSIDFEIIKRKLDFTYINQEKTYGSAEPNLKLVVTDSTRITDIDDIISMVIGNYSGLARTEGENAQEYDYIIDNVSVVILNNNYEIGIISNEGVKFTINKRDAKVNIMPNQNFIYGEIVEIAYEVTNLLEGHYATASLSIADLNAGSKVVYNDEVVILNGDENVCENYAVVFNQANIKVNILPYVIDVSLINLSNGIYNGKAEYALNDNNLLYDIPYIYDNKEIALEIISNAILDSKNIGIRSIVDFINAIAVVDGDIEGKIDNYQIKATESYQVTIDKAGLMVELSNDAEAKQFNKVYDSTVLVSDSNFNVNFSGIFEGDIVNVTVRSLTYNAPTVNDANKVTASFSLNGNDAYNYTISDNSVFDYVATISKKTVTVDFANKIVYGNGIDTLKLNLSYKGFINGDIDLVNPLNMASNFVSDYIVGDGVAEVNRTINICENDYNAINNSIDANGNYSIDGYENLIKSLTIVARELSAEPNKTIFVTGTTNPEISIEFGIGEIYGDDIIGDELIIPTISEDGTYIITITIENENYVLVNSEFTIWVGSVTEVSILINIPSKVYDGQEFSIEDISGITVLDGDNSISVECNYIFIPQVNVGTYSIKVVVNDADYAGQAVGTYTIIKRDVTIVPNANQGKTYGDVDEVFGYTVENMVDSDTISGALDRQKGEGVGTYGYLIGNVFINDNYNLALDSTVLYEITARTAYLAFNDIQKIYDGKTIDAGLFTYVISNVMHGDIFEIMGTAKIDSVDCGEYSIDISDMSITNNNYILAVKSGVAKISKRSAVVSLNNNFKVYGDIDDLTFSVSNVLDIHTLSGVLEREVGENAGKYNLDCSGLTFGDEDINNNYLIVLHTTEYTINKAELSLEADNISIVYGDTIDFNDIDVLISGLKFDDILVKDDIDISYTNEAVINAGNHLKAITIGKCTDLENYIVNDITIDVTIERATLTVTALSNSIVYGATIQSIYYTYDEADLKNGDTAEVIKGNFRAVANNGKPGEYDVVVNTPFYASNGNYNIIAECEGKKLIISKKQIVLSDETVEINDKQFNGSNDAEVFISFEKVGNDEVLVEFNAKFADYNAGIHNVRIYNFVLIGADSGCYEMVDFENNLIDSAFELNFSGKILKFRWIIDDNFVSVMPKVYDGNNLISNSSIIMNIPEHLLETFVSVSGVYNDKNAGEDKIATINARFNIPNSTKNIDYEYGSNVNVRVTNASVAFDIILDNQTIQKRAVQFTAGGVKGGSRQFAITEQGVSSTASLVYTFANLIAGDRVDLKYIAYYVDSEGNAMFDVGNEIKIILDNDEILLSGNDADNYVLNEGTIDISNLKGNITPKIIEIDLSIANKVYDTSTSATVTNNGVRRYDTFIDNEYYYNKIQDYFTWSYISANFESADVRLLNGMPAVRTVILDGIELSIDESVVDDEAFIDGLHTSVLKVSNYAINNVTDGVYFDRATISPVVVGINQDSIILNDKVYDGTNSGTIGEGVKFTGADHLPEVSLSALFNVVWSSANAGSNIEAVITVASLNATLNGGQTVSSNNFVLDSNVLVRRNGTIYRAMIKITNISVLDKFYDATTDAVIENITYNLFTKDSFGNEIQLTSNGAFEGDDVQIIIGNAKFPDKNVMRDSLGNIDSYTIILNDVEIQGLDKDNYCFNYDGNDIISSYEIFNGVIVSAKIKPFVVKYTINANSKVYDGTTNVQYSININSAMPNGEVITIASTGAFASPNVNKYAMVNITDIEIRNKFNAIDGNYVLFGGVENVTAQASIEKAKIYVNIDGITVTYGNENRPNFTVSYKLNGYDMTYDKIANTLKDKDGNIVEGFVPILAYTNATKASNVGSYPILYDNAHSNNFDFIVESGMVNIKKATLTVTVNEYTRFYNYDNPPFVVQFEGFVLGQNKSSAGITEMPVATTNATKNSPNGSYDITISGGKAHNYDFNTSYVGVLNIISGKVSGFEFSSYDSIDNNVYLKSVVYNGVTHSMPVNSRNGYIIEPKYYTDASKTQEAITVIDAGKYYVEVTIYKAMQNNIDKDTNFIPQVLNAVLTINKAKASISVSNKTSVYTGKAIEISKAVLRGDYDVTYTYINEDGIALDSAPSSVGVYTVRVEYDGSNPNYQANFAEVVLSITRIPITISVTQNRFIADGKAKTVIFTSNAPDGVLGQPDFLGVDTSQVGTYNYEIKALDNNYFVTNGVGNIVVGKNSVSLQGGGSATPLNNTIFDKSLSFVISNVDNSGANGSASDKSIWLITENLVSDNSYVQSIMNVQAFIEKSDGNKIETQPDGSIKLVINIPDGLKVKRSTKVYRISDDGTLIALDAVFNKNSQVEFITDEVGYFAFVDDGESRINFMYLMLGGIGLALAAFAMLVVANKLRLLKLVKAANKATK